MLQDQIIFRQARFEELESAVLGKKRAKSKATQKKPGARRPAARRKAGSVKPKTAATRKKTGAKSRARTLAAD